MERFAQWGSGQDLEAMIRWSNSNVYFKPWIDKALARAASREVTAPGYEQSRLMLLLAATVRLKDYERAGAYTELARWVADVPDTLRAPVVRLGQALRFYYEVKKGQPHLLGVVQQWSSAPEDPLSGPVLVACGLDLARSGQLALDFGTLRNAMSETASHDRASTYWGRVIGSYLDSLPDEGSYTEGPTIEALLSAYSIQFKAPGYECEYWTKLADRNKTATTAEGIWRAECLKHALRAAKDDGARVALLGRIESEYHTYMPGKTREVIEALVAELGLGSDRPEVVSIVDKAKKAETAHALKLEKLRQEQVHQVDRGRVEWLRRQLADAKAHQGTRELIQKLEQQIKETEKRLPE
jgi:hypothetical protein